MVIKSSITSAPGVSPARRVRMTKVVHQLHADGVYPSIRVVGELLGGVLNGADGKLWRRLLVELGIEPKRKGERTR